MFEINKYLLIKIGWIEYSPTRGLFFNRLAKTYNLFQDDPLVKFFIEFKEKDYFFVIKELSNLEKQKTKKLYKFIKVDLSNDSPKFEINEFDSNLELFSLIKKNEAGNKEYERYFKLNKILNKK